MPPRIPVSTCLRAPKASLPQPQFILPIRPFSSTPLLSAKSTSKSSSSSRKKQSHDPYLVAQRERKKAANLSRRAELESQRVASLGDPIRGNPTPFVESLATGSPLQYDESAKIPKDEKHLNYALKPQTVEKQLGLSEKIAVPLDELNVEDIKIGQYGWSKFSGDYSRQDNESASKAPAAEEIEAQRKRDHARATEAIARITALENGSSKDRMRVNIARCVQTFGRHNTDTIFPPRAPGLPAVNSTQPHAVRPETNIAATAKRIGPDTGSSEVQIAILTAKIKTLADFLETRGKGDKHNKRNLRLLVHRRQKLLQYLRRKERGGPRWQHCIETLGLTEGTWKGEISL